jgi:Holliday junction resolvasome RuvABC DNA-binding subunit
MPSTVGPLFALKGKINQEWGRDPWIAPSQLIFESQGGQFFTLEVASPHLREKLKVGMEETIFVIQILREDAESLYGFENILERSLFLEIRDFDSVGPKTAALLIASLGVAGIRDLLERGQPPAAKISGLGPKTLDKILIGLKQKKEKFLELYAKAPGQSRLTLSSSLRTADSSVGFDLEGAPLGVVQAMEKLGLRNQDVQSLWNELSKEIADFSKLGNVEMIRHLLQAWGRSKTRTYQSMSQEG